MHGGKTGDEMQFLSCVGSPGALFPKVGSNTLQEVLEQPRRGVVIVGLQYGVQFVCSFTKGRFPGRHCIVFFFFFLKGIFTQELRNLILGN